MTQVVKKEDCRAVAARCLAAVVGGASLRQQLPVWLTHVRNKDHALWRELCYGTMRYYPQLQALLTRLLHKPLKSKDRDITLLLLLGGYQLLYLRIPDYAAIAATVDAVDALGKSWAKGLVNAVLRAWQRRGQELMQSLPVAARDAHPSWLYQHLQRAWPEQLADIVQANNDYPPFCLRVNRQRSTVDDYAQRLMQQQLPSRPCPFAEDGLYLSQAVAVEALPGFAQGDCSVQDEAAQLATGLLALAPSQRVLDACCAPGGKTAHMLEREPMLSLVALDKEATRLADVETTLTRLGLHATLINADAMTVKQWWDGIAFDRILLDAPCSATGVIRRNPDIKVHRRGSDIAALVATQAQLLKALWSTLRPNGLLLYATCSVLPEENEQQIVAFCAAQSDADHVPIEASWGIARPYGRQLLPQCGSHDGFYYALLRKAED